MRGYQMNRVGYVLSRVSARDKYLKVRHLECAAGFRGATASGANRASLGEGVFLCCLLPLPNCGGYGGGCCGLRVRPVTAAWPMNLAWASTGCLAAEPAAPRPRREPCRRTGNFAGSPLDRIAIRIFLNGPLLDGYFSNNPLVGSRSLSPRRFLLRPPSPLPPSSAQAVRANRRTMPAFLHSVGIRLESPQSRAASRRVLLLFCLVFSREASRAELRKKNEIVGLLRSLQMHQIDRMTGIPYAS
jgi:hypothetical protein